MMRFVPITPIHASALYTRRLMKIKNESTADSLNRASNCEAMGGLLK